MCESFARVSKRRNPDGVFYAKGFCTDSNRRSRRAGNSGHRLSGTLVIESLGLEALTFGLGCFLGCWHSCLIEFANLI